MPRLPLQAPPAAADDHQTGAGDNQGGGHEGVALDVGPGAREQALDGGRRGGDRLPGLSGLAGRAAGATCPAGTACPAATAGSAAPSAAGGAVVEDEVAGPAAGAAAPGRPVVRRAGHVGAAAAND